MLEHQLLGLAVVIVPGLLCLRLKRKEESRRQHLKELLSKGSPVLTVFSVCLQSPHVCQERLCTRSVLVVAQNQTQLLFGSVVLCCDSHPVVAFGSSMSGT